MLARRGPQPAPRCASGVRPPPTPTRPPIRRASLGLASRGRSRCALRHSRLVSGPMRNTRRLLVVVLLAGCVVTRSKYDRALGVATKYQADRLQSEADRDIAVARYEDQLKQ